MSETTWLKELESMSFDELHEMANRIEKLQGTFLKKMVEVGQAKVLVHEEIFKRIEEKTKEDKQ